MLEGLNSAAAGMAAQQQRLDAVAGDLANANTTGYKHRRVGFRDLVYEQAGRPAADGVRTGHGAAAVDAGKSFGQGALQRTDRPLDVAIQGAGFLRVRLADGTQALTRDGNLQIDGRGRLATSTGGLVRAGALEASGADAARSMVDMIASMRAFEAGQKVIQTIDSTLDKAANRVGAVGG